MITPKNFTTVITLKITAPTLHQLQWTIIAVALRAKKYRQVDLAIALNVSRSELSSWRVQGIPKDFVGEIEKLLEVDLKTFLRNST